MATVRYCKKCNEYTNHIYVGELKEAEDASFNRFATIMTLGGYQAARRFIDDSPKCLACSKCGNIFKETYF